MKICFYLDFDKTALIASQLWFLDFRNLPDVFADFMLAGVDFGPV